MNTLILLKSNFINLLYKIKYIFIIKHKNFSHGILDHRHLQFLADVSNKKRSLIKPAELDVERK